MSGLLQLSDVADLIPQNDENLPHLKDRLADLLQSKKRGFPGAQPVSFARKHLRALKEAEYAEQDSYISHMSKLTSGTKAKPGPARRRPRILTQPSSYFVCEKTDGIRCLLYLSFFVDADGQQQEAAFLVDRKNDFYYINNPSFHFPLPNAPPDSFHTETLADGELVLDTFPNGQTVKRYLVFDCLALDGSSITHRTLDKRLGHFNNHVVEPQKELFRKYPEEKAQQPFEVIMKKMEKSYGIMAIIKDVLPNLLHGNDGLVFTCRTTPYVSGTDPHILKWKPPHENTVDFRLQLGSFPRLGVNGFTNGNGVAEDEEVDFDACPSFALLVHEGQGRHRLYADLYVAEDEWESMKSVGEILDGRIIECYKDDQGRWRFKREKDGTPRFRDDKDDANHISTVTSVLESIEDAVSEQDLFAHAAEIRSAWKHRETEFRQREEAERRAAHAKPA